MKCIRIRLRFNRHRIIETENSKFHKKATRRTWDDMQLLRLRRQRRIAWPAHTRVFLSRRQARKPPRTTGGL